MFKQYMYDSFNIFNFGRFELGDTYNPHRGVYHGAGGRDGPEQGTLLLYINKLARKNC